MQGFEQRIFFFFLRPLEKKKKTLAALTKNTVDCRSRSRLSWEAVAIIHMRDEDGSNEGESSGREEVGFWIFSQDSSI